MPERGIGVVNTELAIELALHLCNWTWRNGFSGSKIDLI
jgi:hypothetical protein